MNTKPLRQLALRLLVTALRVFTRAAPAGWQRSKRPVHLRGS